MKPVRIYRKFDNPSFPLQITNFPTRRIMERFINIHWHPEPEILFVTDGEYEIYSETGHFLLHPGEACLIPNGKVHAIRALSSFGNYWSISFSMDLIQLSDNHFFQQSFVAPLKSGTLQIPQKFTLQHGLTPDATHALEQIIAGTQSQQFLALLAFFIEILPACKPIGQKRNLQQSHDATAACIAYMETNYHSKITLEDLAELVHLHPNYLCALFKRNSGQTVFQYLNTLRIRKARTILNKENIPISLVAERVGFVDVDHFSRTFKQQMGISPSAYRKAYNEK